MMMRMMPVLAALDADHDGKISKAEIENATAALSRNWTRTVMVNLPKRNFGQNSHRRLLDGEDPVVGLRAEDDRADSADHRKVAVLAAIRQAVHPKWWNASWSSIKTRTARSPRTSCPNACRA